MSIDEKILKMRTKKLAVAIIEQMDKFPIHKETDEILPMTVASIKTLRNRKQSSIVNLKS